MEMIKATSLTKYYRKARGIIDLNLTVKEGEFFGFIGPNGAGKSTFIRCLLGLIHADSGSASIMEMDIRKQKNDILNSIGYLPSEAMFYPGMKVKDILNLSSQLRKKDCQPEQDCLCNRLLLDRSKKVDELSFGNRKKVAIVSALQHHPKLLILDEPTSGLDPLMQREFFNILQERNKEGCTIFFSSHILSEVQNNCTRAAIIKDGRIITCDQVETLTQTNARRIHIKGIINLENLTGIKDLKKDADSINFLFQGDINTLIRTLSKGNIKDLTVSEPDLEEIFLHYYIDGGERK
ncbi:MAG: ABC transporter ATP-binding protein [Lachnospiraceae bacterium]|nr:ABC transporter ATP-binding protein [Lachnospiraceae bacterium]